jgi:hypothetical protein
MSPGRGPEDAIEAISPKSSESVEPSIGRGSILGVMIVKPEVYTTGYKTPRGTY